MGNRRTRPISALEQEIVKIYAEVAIGSSGAPTLTRGQGVASISRSTNGTYLVTLSDSYNVLMGFTANILQASSQDLYPKLIAETIGSAKTVTFETLTGATPTDPASGSVIFMEITVKNSSVI